MTESEAWRNIAEKFDGDEGVLLGLCHAIRTAYVPENMRAQMRKRLTLFSNGPVWYWPTTNTRNARTLRATACGFLAAMAEEDANHE